MLWINTLLLALAVLVCQCRFNFPHLCRSKIPQGAGYGDQPAV
jgi:hypothetical protein